MHTILRHMKDQNKKVANLKHNQQMEKKKNAQLLEEVRRREDNMTDNSQHLQVSCFNLSKYSGSVLLQKNKQVNVLQT